MCEVHISCNFPRNFLSLPLWSSFGVSALAPILTCNSASNHMQPLWQDNNHTSVENSRVLRFRGWCWLWVLMDLSISAALVVRFRVHVSPQLNGTVTILLLEEILKCVKLDPLSLWSSCGVPALRHWHTTLHLITCNYLYGRIIITPLLKTPEFFTISWLMLIVDLVSAALEARFRYS
jgi:hypothetical protein